MNFLKNIISYVFPFTTRLQTEKNGILELTYSNGRLRLGSRNTNYSYGSLQRILKFGLEKVKPKANDKILLLGLGGGSVIKTLREECGIKSKIVAVEIDKTIIEIALVYFRLGSDNTLEIHHADAATFVRSYSGQFDLIIIDLFIDREVPEIFFESNTWRALNRITSAKGSFIFNVSMHGGVNEKLDKLITDLNERYLLQRYDQVEGKYTLLIGMKK